MNGTARRSISFAVALCCLALVGGGLTYWSAARAPVRPVSSSLSTAMSWLTVLLALCMAAAAVISVSHLLTRRNSGAPAWSRRYAKLIDGLPLWVPVLPVALSASYLAARIGLSPDPNANYWLALGLWLGALTLLLVAFIPGRGRAGPRVQFSRPTWSRILLSEAVIVALLAAVSLSLRAVKLDAAPFLTNGDEEAMRPDVVADNIKNMFAVGWGVGWADIPSTYFFVVAGAFKVFGTSVVGLRMVSALVGVAAVVVTYLLLREMFGRGQGLIGALFMAGYHLHLHFSRAGLVNVWDTLAAALAMYFGYRASKSQRPFDFAALGLVSGLTLYAYVSARAAVLVVIAYLIYVAIFRRSFLRDNLAKMALAVVAFCLAAMPMGAFYLTHTEVFTSRPSSELLFHTGWYEQQLDLGRSSMSILWDQVLHAFGGFVYYPMSPANANLYDARHPLIPGLAAVPFIAGFVYSVLHIEKKEYGLLLLGLVVPTVLGGVLTVPPTQWQRFLGTIPAVSGLVAVGLWQLADRLLAWKRSAILPAALLAVIFLAAQNIDLYFRAAVADQSYGAPIRGVTVDYVDSLPQDTRVYWFGAPAVWVEGSFVGLSLHDRELIDVFDADPEGLPVVDRPSPTVYLFMPHREPELPALRTKCPGGIRKELSFRGRKVLAVYELWRPNTCVPTLEPPPANDHFLNSTPCGGVANTAWYSFTPSAAMRVVARTIGSSADTLVAAYEGDELSALTPLACSTHLPDRRAAVELTARADVPYHFQVAARSYSVGTVTFSLVELSRRSSFLCGDRVQRAESRC